MHTNWPARILCPVDFSEPSAAALRHAGAFQRLAGGSLTVLHAHSWQAPAYFTESQLAELKRQFDESLAAAGGALQEFIARVCPECEAARRVADARPVEGILAAAEETGADLLVLGTHGRSGWDRFLLGSVTERVLRRTSAAVLTVRAGADAAPRYERVLCPANNTAAARKSLEIAAGIAAGFGAELTVLHVDEPERKSSRPEVCGWLPETARASCLLREVVRSGDAAEETLKLAEELRADLLVIGARRRAFRDTVVLGSTTERLARHSRIPVLTVVNAS